MPRRRGGTRPAEPPDIRKIEVPASLRRRWGWRLDQAWSRLRYETDALLVHVANRLRLRDVVAARGRTPLGRLYNRLTGQTPDFVELDGQVILQLFELIGEDPPAAIERAATYRVGHADARRWHEQARDAATAEGTRRTRRRSDAGR